VLNTNTLSLFVDEREAILAKIADEFGSPRLTAEPLPPQAWGKNLWSLLWPRDWDRLRKATYAQAQHHCEICGGVGARIRLACHERWEIAEWCCTSDLVGLIALCPACHDVKHIGRAIEQGRRRQCAEQLRKVNSWSARQVEHYLTAIGTLSELRTLEHKWYVEFRPWLKRHNITIRESSAIKSRRNAGRGRSEK
jgi:hypothetical protein